MLEVVAYEGIMFGLDVSGLLIILGILLLLYGAGRLPKFSRSGGNAALEFQHTMSEDPHKPNENS